ncbi:MAG: SDR family oxidoreductase, partial [Alphaproteobacteria bacterium]|nr:SDR family oxidoreductase [Alphaproteobacteria bacterium]
MGRLSGKTAIVLGASGSHSFGRAIAELYAKEGANVVVSARREGPLEELASEIGGKAVACDITDDDQLGALAKAAVDEYGSLDIAVNCAGILAGAPIAMLKPENIKPTMDISFMGS